jgi:hypothetical protein
VKARFLVALILIILGVGLPLAAVQSHGLPWGYRDRVAVVVSHVGAVEVFSSKTRVDGAPAAVLIAPGLGLVAGDEVRVGVLSFTEIRFPTGDVEVFDGGRVKIDDGGIEITRGATSFDVHTGAMRLASDVFAFAATLMPGRYRALSDGRERLAVVVEEGRLDVDGGDAARAGQMLVVERGNKPRIGELPDPPKCSIRCRVVGPGNALAEGEISAHAMGWLNGAFVFGDQRSKFSMPIALDGDDGQATLFARDVILRGCKAEARCTP